MMFFLERAALLAPTLALVGVLLVGARMSGKREKRVLTFTVIALASILALFLGLVFVFLYGDRLPPDIIVRNETRSAAVVETRPEGGGVVGPADEGRFAGPYSLQEIALYEESRPSQRLRLTFGDGLHLKHEVVVTISAWPAGWPTGPD